MAEVFFFGCWPQYGQVGHYWWTPNRNNYPKLPEDCPFSGVYYEKLPIDGKYAPRYPAKQSYPGAEGAGMPQGLATVTHFNNPEWTLLSFWDSSGDKRGGSNSNFLIRGNKTFSECLDAAKEAFPEIWARFPFDVTEHPAAASSAF